MKLTIEQKEWIGNLCEKASDLKESIKDGNYLLAWDIDHYGHFSLRLYVRTTNDLANIAGNSVPVFNRDGRPNDGCLLSLQEIREYYEQVIKNKANEKRARVEALEKELADLKAKED